MVDPIVRALAAAELADDPESQREWLIGNGLGGYAAGTLSGAMTRRFHGLLIAALPAPLGRVNMLSAVAESVVLPDGAAFVLTPPAGRPAPDTPPSLPAAIVDFRLVHGLPVWRYQAGPFVIEKQIIVPWGQNSAYVCYRRLDGGPAPLRLHLRPALRLRRHDSRIDEPLATDYILTTAPANANALGYELSLPGPLPALRLLLDGDRAAFTLAPGRLCDVELPIERARGYDYRGDFYTPGAFAVDLPPGGAASLLATTEPWDIASALCADEALALTLERRRRLLIQAGPATQDATAAELILAADQFLITPAGRVADAARAHAAGDDVHTVIAGYPWFTDWGRDTMISLEGLTLCTGRHAEAASILRTFARYARDGLIPNLFPEGQSAGLYHTADATLWFFHAVDRYVTATGDTETLRQLLPVLRRSADAHLTGTRFGIGCDPTDGLLRQGEPGYQLTWMDAKVGDWVVTPRRGKAVEINALFYNALCLLADWLGADGAPYAAAAERARLAFNARFPAPGGGLYDVIDSAQQSGAPSIDGERGDDPSCRPNQILSFSLRHPVLDPARWPAVLAVVERQLLTPLGLRTLAPSDPAYQPRYDGDLRARDAAYHQGTVWPWLIGPFIDAWLRVHPSDRTGARRFLAAFPAHLSQACIGSVSEICDAEPPYHPRGCVAQAWSVAEVLRAWLKTAT